MLGAVGGARAETLIYVTPTLIGTVDSSNVAVDNTPQQWPPGLYHAGRFPALVGAKVPEDTGTLFLLGYLGPSNANPNNGTCQLFAANTTGAAGIASLTAVNEAYGCTIGSTAGDLGFVQGSGGSQYNDAYVVAN